MAVPTTPMHSQASQPCPAKLRASPAPWPAQDDDDSDEPMEDVETVVFPLFSQFPPEIRHQIYLAAIPSTGINFFNIHTFPNDHQGANRSSSPPSLHLDLRRLDIDDDDETVAQYDPSAWQARDALRRTCREARQICAIPEDRLVTLTLTIPKRGLFVRAGDGLMRSMTPLENPDLFRADDDDGPAAERESIVRRTIHLDADEMISLSIENCSFNLPFEESPLQGSDDEDVDDMGWSYDPEFPGGVPLGIAPDKFCLNLARGDFTSLRALREVAPALWKAATGHWATDFDNVKDLGGVYRQGKERRSRQTESFIMLDSQTTSIEPARRRSALKQRRPRPNGGSSTDDDSPAATNVVYWDRWGDAYISRAWDDDAFFTNQQLVKTLPEQTDMRARYLASAILQSPKRPRGYPE